jgi:hypothetical protein
MYCLIYIISYKYIMKPTVKHNRKLRFAVNSRIITRRRMKGILKRGGTQKRRTRRR